jgi:hypothetical protein
MSESKRKREATLAGGSSHKDFIMRDTFSTIADRSTVTQGMTYPTLGFSEILKDSDKPLTLMERNLLCQMILSFDVPLY